MKSGEIIMRFREQQIILEKNLKIINNTVSEVSSKRKYYWGSYKN